MEARVCWRCLVRASPENTTFSTFPLRNSTPGKSASFSTSTPSLAAKTPAFVPQRGAKTTFIKKKGKRQNEVKAKRPAPGERKAYRKRIVLSNTNAVQIPGIEDFSVEHLGTEESKGKVLGIPGAVIDQLRAVEAFKPTQLWGLFRTPRMLIRGETIEYGRLFEELEANRSSLRRVLVGDRGNGKSLILLQAMTIAFLKGWTVINIPEAQELTIGHTDYAPLPGTSPLLFVQKSYTAKLLSQIIKANPHLARFQLSSSSASSTMPIPIPENISLARLAGLGASDPEIAWPIFQLLLSDLTTRNEDLAEDQKRPPVLFCIDSLAHAMKNKTAYMTAAFKPIHAHDLAIVSWYMSYLSGTNALPNGGLILAATSASNAPPNPSLDLALAQLEASVQLSSSTTTTDFYQPLPATPNPFFHYDRRVLDIFKLSAQQSSNSKIDVQRLPGLAKEEARGLMDYWARSGILRHHIDDGLVGEKWTMSGGGVVGELERGCIAMRV